jgi:hypothetical protein
MGHELDERVTLWAMAGYGEGSLRLRPEGLSALKSDMSLAMGALGARGQLIEPEDETGLSLTLDGDAFWARTASERAVGLAGARGEATRVRVALKGGYGFALDGGGRLTPSFEIGLRQDGGDAETGYGLDAGSGLAWSEPERGLSTEVSVRALLSHEAAGLNDHGAQAAFAWDADPSSERGFSLSLRTLAGSAATGGAQALLGRAAMTELSGDTDARGRAEVQLGYGLPAFGGAYTGTPNLNAGWSENGPDWRLGWRLSRERRGVVELGLDLGAEVRDSTGSGTDRKLEMRGTVRW